MSRIVSFILFLFCAAFAYAKPVEIVFWHSMAGQLGTKLNELVRGFNDTQTQYLIKPIYKGNYVESLTSFAAAFRAHKPPALIQVFEVGTTTMLYPPGIIKPVDEIMRQAKLSLPKESFFPILLAQYSRHGELMAMPFNVSIPVMFYNTKVLGKLGYTPESFPHTWNELEQLAIKLKQAGFACAYTSAYPAWILIESFAALHGLPMVEEEQAVYNTPVMSRHLERLVRWQTAHYFQYGGREDDATILFTSGRCPLLSQSSGAFGGLESLVPFKVGIASMPYDEQISLKRFPNVAGGAALWAVAKQSPEIYLGIAHFFVYWAKVQTQTKWHVQTGYLPLGVSGVYQALMLNPHSSLLELAQSELAVGERNIPVQIIPNQIRRINDEALETIFAKIKTPQEALNVAVQRANQALSRFILNTEVRQKKTQ